MSLSSVLNSLVAIGYLWCSWQLWRKAAGRLQLAVLWLVWIAHLMLMTVLEFNTRSFGFASALSMTTWLVLGVYWLERFWLLPRSFAPRVMLAAALSIWLRQLFPGDRTLDLSHFSTVLHWSTGVAAYGMVTAALLHGLSLRNADRALHSAVQPLAGLPLLTIEKLTYRLLLWGFVLLSISMLAGVVSLPSDKWLNHKLVFSALSWLLFAVLLLGRHLAGWRGKSALRWLYVGSGSLLLAYVGTQFVLEVILQR